MYELIQGSRALMENEAANSDGLKAPKTALRGC